MSEAARVYPMDPVGVDENSLAYKLQLHHARFDGAVCRILNTEDPFRADWVNFWTDSGESVNPAKLACGRCALKNPCLVMALENSDDYGIFGGASGRERKEIREAYNTGRSDGIIDETVSLGKFAVKNRDKFIKPANKAKDAPRTSYPPLSMKRSRCLNEASEIFEDLDSKPNSDLTREDFAKAIAECLQCTQLVVCDSDSLTPDFQPTVVAAQTVGHIPVKLRPRKRDINAFLPEDHPDKQKPVPAKAKNPTPLELIDRESLSPDIPRAAFMSLLKGGMLSVCELEDLWQRAEQGRNGRSEEPVNLDDLLDFEYANRETLSFDESLALKKLFDYLG